MYSKGCEYAIRALTHVVSTEGKERFQAAEVCEEVGIPEPYTRKVLQALVSDGLLNAVRGPHGGYELVRPASEISMLELIKAVDGQDTFDGCVLGLPMCGCAKPCPLHETWGPVKGELLTCLASVTLQQIVDSVTS